jgi:hypothetical protein
MRHVWRRLRFAPREGGMKRSLGRCGRTVGVSNCRRAAISMYQKSRAVSAHLCRHVPLYGIGNSLYFRRTNYYG